MVGDQLQCFWEIIFRVETTETFVNNLLVTNALFFCLRLWSCEGKDKEAFILIQC